MEAALLELIPKIRPDASFDLHPFRGKPDLLNKMPGRLRGYLHWHTDDLRVVVVVDRDDDDCRYLKQRIMDMSQLAGMPLLCRIAIEELEAWLIGDVAALRQAYPGVPASLGNRAAYRYPDEISGGTWEALERVLKRAGYYATGMPKVEVASRVAEHMDPENNRSVSFCVFRDGIRGLG